MFSYRTCNMLYCNTSDLAKLQLFYIHFSSRYTSWLNRVSSLIFQTLLLQQSSQSKQNAFFILFINISLFALRRFSERRNRKHRILIFFLVQAEGFSLKLFKIAKLFCVLFKTVTTLTKKIQINFNVSSLQEICFTSKLYQDRYVLVVFYILCKRPFNNSIIQREIISLLLFLLFFTVHCHLLPFF